MAAVLLATGCASSFNGPYQTPAVNVPAQYANDTMSTASRAAATNRVSADPWWTNFGDPELDRLVNAALQRNNNLAAATIRVRRAQLQAGIADNKLAPQFSGSGNIGVSRALESGASSTRNNGVSLGAGYEVDLWNKLGSQRDVARWEAEATAQDREATRLALIGTTAQLYWQLAYINQRLASSDLSIAYAQKTFDLVQAQYRAGATSGLELAEAQQSLANQLANRTTLQQQAVEATTALALLFDGPPGTSVTNPQALPMSTLPVVDAGLPAELLGRRPDLRAAELRVRESFTTIDATRASYYPSLNLTASLGSSSAALLSVLQNPVAALGAGISLPFLQRTQMKLNIQVSEAQYEEAVVNFRQTLYTALGDVENALSARQQFMRQGELLEQALVAARKAEQLYEARYRAGAVALKVWLDSQEQRRSAEIAVTENRLNRLLNQVVLYQALGGDAVVR
ncbi:MAG: efflux transporter outer membrane subunit [Comamonadaceae bacterium]|nr:MAG: efflux transporter outer membrane subunit [Comamonadaceae bacterium]